MTCDTLNYIKECPECIKTKGSHSIKSMTNKIEVKGPRERYVSNSWKLSKNISEETGDIKF